MEIVYAEILCALCSTHRLIQADPQKKSVKKLRKCLAVSEKSGNFATLFGALCTFSNRNCLTVSGAKCARRV